MILRGEATELFYLDPADKRDILIEGGANCGKTHTVCAFVAWYCEEHAGARVLMLRKVRADIVQSVLVKPWEDHIIDLHLAQGLVEVSGGARRDSYTFRENGSLVVAGGLDQVTRHMGAGWDLIVIFEATEATLDDYEYLVTRTSREPSPSGGRSLIVLDCNPAAPDHWLNQLALSGRLRRLCAKHEDNPNLFNADGTPTPLGAEYIGKLDNLTGAKKQRLRFHLWWAEAGLIWPEYDPQRHGPLGYSRQKYEWEYICGGFDWGWTDAGCVELFGVFQGCAYRIYEVYRTQQGQPWWADRIADLNELCVKHHGRAIDTLLVSHERPDFVDLLNKLLVSKRMRALAQRYKPQRWKTGAERVRWFLRPHSAPEMAADEFEPGAAPRVYFFPESQLWGPDEELKANLKPWSWETEVSSYVWAESPEGRRSKEEPDPGCANHAADAVSMGLYAAWNYLGGPEDRGRHDKPLPKHPLARKDAEAYRNLIGAGKPSRKGPGR